MNQLLLEGDDFVDAIVNYSSSIAIVPFFLRIVVVEAWWYVQTDPAPIAILLFRLLHSLVMSISFQNIYFSFSEIDS